MKYTLYSSLTAPYLSPGFIHKFQFILTCGALSATLEMCFSTWREKEMTLKTEVF